MKVEIGVLGAVTGILAGLGRARRFVITLAILLTSSGVAALLVGAMALARGQFFWVWYPLLLEGVIATAVGGCLILLFRWRYAQIELRKMTATDAAVAGK